MEILQNILVFLTFLVALGYIISKFIWKPSFVTGKKKDAKCGVSGCVDSD